MSVSSALLKIATRVFKFLIVRPLKRYNNQNRALKHLGPEASKFKPAPRNIGYQVEKKLVAEQEPYKRVTRGSEDTSRSSLSESQADDKSLIEGVNKLTIKKLPVEAPVAPNQQKQLPTAEKSHRPLPTLRSLPLSDPLSIWYTVQRLPYGRLNVEKLDEMMLNRLANKSYSPQEAAERYKIDVGHATKLFKYVAPYKLVVSPRMYQNLELVGRDNKLFQQVKHFAIEINESLRNDLDKRYDDKPEEPDKLAEPEVDRLDVKPLNAPKTSRLPNQTERPKRLTSKIKPSENEQVKQD